MLKPRHALKDIDRASDALRQLVGNVPIVHVLDIEAPAAAREWGAKLIVRLRVNGQHHLLVCEYKASGQPRFARSAILELREYLAQQAAEATPVLIAPYISPAVRRLCEEKDVGYLDLEGNARIAFGGVFIERQAADRPAAERRELKSLFSPKSAQVLRVLLREPSRAWRVAALSEIAGVSLGHVSNVRTGLLNREWARTADDGLVLSQPDAVLDAWRDSYTSPPGKRLRFYTHLHGSAFENAARTVLRADGEPGRAVFASFSAAKWLSPYGRIGTHYFYADDDGLRKLQSTLNLAPAAKGENVVVTVPDDAGAFAFTIEPAPGVVCTSPLQTYLDLSIAGERGAEAAEHLRHDKLSWSQ